MSGVSRFVRRHSSGSPRVSSAVPKRVRFDAGRNLIRTTQLGTLSQAIEIDSDEERESSRLDDFNFNYSTWKPAAMAAPHSDTKVTETNSNTRLNLKRKLNEYISL
jgi:hypothetical protein